MSAPSEQRRVAVVTGASSGIGKETARALLLQGWRVFGVGRDPERTAAAEHELRASAPGADLHMIRADLALLADAESAADAISARTDQVHVLVNNAGGMATKKVVTAEGFEENFAGNHIGPFLLTKRLLPLLRRAAVGAPLGSVRIINTSSDASEMIAAIPFDDLKNPTEYQPGAAYCYSKLANVLFACALAKRLTADNIVAHAMHPGTVGTNFFTHLYTDADERTRNHVKNLTKISPQEGADTLIWLATSDEAGATSGGYWFKRAPRKPNPLAADDATLTRLWEVSEALIAGAGH